MKNRDIRKLENHLMAAEENTSPKCRVYNRDHVDVDLEDFALQVDTPLKKRFHWGWLFLLIMAAAVLWYVTGGKFPWN